MTAARGGPPGSSGPSPALVAAAAHVFVDDLESPALEDDDAHHLGRVLRLRDGEVVTACDGAGRWRACRFVRGSLDVDGDVVCVPSPAFAVSVAFAIPKGDRPELIVQKLTEVGADVVVPMTTARTVVRWDAERAQRNVERLRRVAREAAMQSRRVRLPLVDVLHEFGTVVSRPGAVLAAPGGAPMPLDGGAPALVLIGPEGGWTEAELVAAPATVNLGEQVLRAETAAIVACTLLVAARARSIEI